MYLNLTTYQVLNTVLSKLTEMVITWFVVLFATATGNYQLGQLVPRGVIDTLAGVGGRHRIYYSSLISVVFIAIFLAVSAGNGILLSRCFQENTAHKGVLTKAQELSANFAAFSALTERKKVELGAITPSTVAEQLGVRLSSSNYHQVPEELRLESILPQETGQCGNLFVTDQGNLGHYAITRCTEEQTVVFPSKRFSTGAVVNGAIIVKPLTVDPVSLDLRFWDPVRKGYTTLPPDFRAKSVPESANGNPVTSRAVTMAMFAGNGTADLLLVTSEWKSKTYLGGLPSDNQRLADEIGVERSYVDTRWSTLNSYTLNNTQTLFSAATFSVNRGSVIRSASCTLYGFIRQSTGSADTAMGCAHSQYELYRIIGTNDSPSTSWSEGSYYVQGDVKATSWGVLANADKIVSVVGPTFTEQGQFIPKLLADAVPVRVDLLGAARMMRTSLRNTKDFPPIPAGEPKILVLKWLYIVWVPALLVTCIVGLFLRKCSTSIERECLSSVIASSIIPGRQDCTTGKGRQLRVRYAKLSGVDHLALTVGGSVVGIVEHENADFSVSTTIKALQGLPFPQFDSGMKTRAAEDKSLACLHWHNECDCNHKTQKDLCRDEGIPLMDMKGLLHRATKIPSCDE